MCSDSYPIPILFIPSLYPLPFLFSSLLIFTACMHVQSPGVQYTVADPGLLRNPPFQQCQSIVMVVNSNDPSLSLLFPSPPQLGYRRNPTLGDSLVRASLPGSSCPPTGQVPPIPINKLQPHMVKCTNGCCKMCPKAEGRCILFSMMSNTPYAFHETFTYTDTSLIYCIVCDKSFPTA